MRIVGLTNLVVDFYIFEDKIFLNGGGTVANILANLSSMGINTCVFGYYANDKLGTFAKNQLIHIGVDTSLLEMKDYKTKCFFISKNGTSSICPYCKEHRRNYKARKGIDNFLSEEDIILVQDVHDLINVKNKIIWDFGYEKGIIYMDEVKLAKLIFQKYFIVNFKKQVLDFILKKLKLTFKEFILKVNIDYMIITDGKNGTVIVHKNNVYQFTPEVIQEVETNGCRDMYLATFIYEIINNQEFPDFEMINEKAQRNVQEVLMRIGARDYVSPNIEINFNNKCICEDFIIK